MLSGVTCEACHGPASRDVHDRDEYGRVNASNCLGCHTAQMDPSFSFHDSFRLIRYDQ